MISDASVSDNLRIKDFLMKKKSPQDDILFLYRSISRKKTDLVSENNKSKIVNVVDIVLLNIHAIHVHQNISDHDHRSCVIVPRLIQRWQKIIVKRLEYILANFVLQVLRHDFLQSSV